MSAPSPEQIARAKALHAAWSEPAEGRLFMVTVRQSAQVLVCARTPDEAEKHAAKVSNYDLAFDDELEAEVDTEIRDMKHAERLHCEREIPYGDSGARTVRQILTEREEARAEAAARKAVFDATSDLFPGGASAAPDGEPQGEESGT